MKSTFFKLSLMVLAVTLLAQDAPAQKAYFHINAGYGIKMSSQYISAFNFYNSTESASSMSREQVYVSFGQGLIVGGGFGYLFNQYVGAELSASWLKGHRYTARKMDPDKSTDMALSSQMVRLNPAIVILAGFRKINPYAKFGLIAGSGQFFSNRLN